ncbi:Hypothetical predicted protein [Cloeon dipterum]|uniref:Uncharacterized protein n=1 Tax=Cloeon dipterum TaxID=197152 RepID=A0A8S1DPR3_9INSE|nr:Hypothetical predicted protein [Cloeon dipterum]
MISERVPFRLQAGFSSLGMAFLKMIHYFPPRHYLQLQEMEPKCVYCSNVVKRDKSYRLLTKKEAKKVPKMCSCHFNILYDRTNHKTPQDPKQICSRCSHLLRVYQRRCFYTSGDIRQRLICEGTITEKIREQESDGDE